MSIELDAAERMSAVLAHITLDGNEEGTAYSIATSRKPPWHQFGPTFEKDMTIEQALKESHTDWDVVAQDLTTQWVGEDGVTTVTAPDRTARIAPDPYTGAPVYLNTVGRGLPIVQNREALEWAYDILGAARESHTDQGLITSVGTWAQQKKFFATVVLPDSIRVGGQDPVDLYLTVLEHHDGMGALTAVLSPVRAECRNTTTIAVKGSKARVALRHTSGIQGRMTQVRELLDISEDYTAAFEKMAQEMWDREFTDLQFEAMVGELTTPKPDPEKASKTAVTQWTNTFEAMKAQRYAPENAGSQPGSGWNAFQAVVSYDNYEKKVRGEDDEAKQFARAGGILLGANDVVEQKAMAYILARR